MVQALKILLAVYVILLINRVVYLVKQYRLDKKKIKREREMEISWIEAKHGRNAGLGRSAVLEGNIENAFEKYQHKLDKRRNKFIYDLINSIITCITSIFRK